MSTENKSVPDKIVEPTPIAAVVAPDAVAAVVEPAVEVKAEPVVAAVVEPVVEVKAEPVVAAVVEPVVEVKTEPVVAAVVEPVVAAVVEPVVAAVVEPVVEPVVEVKAEPVVETKVVSDISIDHKEWVSGAVFGVHLEMLKHLLDKYSVTDIAGFQHAAKLAIQTNNLNVFDFVKDNYSIGDLDVIGASVCFGAHHIFNKYYGGDPLEIKNSRVLFEKVDDATFAKKRLEVIKSVISRGAFHEDAFDWLCDEKYYDLAKTCTIDSNKQQSELKSAITSGDLKKFQMLRSLPSPFPCCKDPCWMILEATRSGNVEMVKDLHCIDEHNLAECKKLAGSNADLIVALGSI